MPKAGFYPDPTERYVQRYWSGAEWTDRVTDSADEYADALRQSFPEPDEGLISHRSQQRGAGWSVAKVTFNSLPLEDRTAVARAIAVPIGIVIYGIAAWFGLFGWILLATVVYYAFAFIVLPIALRALGVTNRGRINLIAELAATIPAAAVLWPPLQSVGFHPHGGSSNICLLINSAANCQ